MIRDILIKERKKAAIAAVLVIAALISFFFISGYATDAKNFSGTMKALDEKSTAVLALTGGSTAASAAISLIPGDAGTPIADKLADLSGYFLFILAAIYLEKWMITVMGLLAFRYIIPVCLIVLAVLLFRPNVTIRSACIKLICFALIMFATVPFSVVLSDLIDDSYKATIEQTIEDAEKSSKAIQENVSDEEDESAIEKFFNDLKGGISGQLDKFKDILSNFIQAIAVLLVTSCVIPVAVAAFALWLVKLLIGVDIKIPDLRLSDGIKELKGQAE